MGKVFKADGRIGFRRNEEEALYPVPDSAPVIDVDFDANPLLLEALETDAHSFDIVAGVLLQRGAPYTLVTETPLYALRRLASQLNGQQIANLSNNDFRRLVALLAAETGWLAPDGTLRIRRNGTLRQ